MMRRTLQTTASRARPCVFWLFLLFGVGVLPAVAQSTITVNSAADNSVAGDGVCTLREAIVNANTDTDATNGDCAAGSGDDTIAFNIPGAGVQTIQPLTPLPEITETVTMNGYTQPGASANTQAMDSDATLLIELDGSLAGEGVDGLRITASDNIILGLVINRFSGDGIVLTRSGTVNNIIKGNYIGTDDTGNVDLGNAGSGVSIEIGAQSNDIGREEASARNVISGNGASGVRIENSSTSMNKVKGNYIGVDANGMTALGNDEHGVHIRNAASDNVIGGSSTGERNVISGNVKDGISIENIGTTRNSVQGNYIGTDATGEAPLANGFDGLSILEGATDTMVGGTDGTTPGGQCTGACNLISGNMRYGIAIAHLGTTDTRIQGNYIGIDVTGMKELGNGDTGVLINAGPSNTTIGGTTPEARNVISGNGSSSVHIAMADGNTVQGNYIGTDVNGINGLGGSVGLAEGASNNTIGGTVGTTPGGPCTGACNLISGSSSTALDIDGSGTDNNVVQGNYIGTDKNGTARLSNEARNVIGVFISNGASNNLIGGTEQEAGNRIAHNQVNGVALGADAGTGNAIRGNAIFQNDALGIDLGNNGATDNDSGDGDDGPNKLQNFPVITTAEIDGGNLSVTYSVDTDQGSATYPLTIEFFEADTNGEEGQRFLGSVTCNTAPCTNETAILNDVTGLSVDESIVATATDAEGNTSEFSFPAASVTALSNQKPVAGFTEQCTDLSCQFTDQSSDPDGSIASWNWDFGDDSTSTEQHPLHAYTSGGMYTVMLTVTDDSLATDTSSQTITVAAPPNMAPTASFMADQTSGQAPLNVNFDASASNDPDGSVDNYAWNFGDTTTDSGTTPTTSHVYMQPGRFTVLLTVTDDDQATDTTSLTIRVDPGSFSYMINQPFGNTADSTNYRLVALPGSEEISLPSTLTGTIGTEWIAYSDNGTASYPTRFSGSFGPGRGYWLLSKQTWSPSGTASAVSLTDGIYSINVNAGGWTIISNPFNVDVPWADVLAVNSLSQNTPLYGFDGDYNPPATSLTSAATDGEAFYFNNETGLSQLMIPYPGLATIPETTPLPPPTRVLTLSVYLDGEPVSSVRVGTAQEARPGRDAYDVVGPPGVFEAVGLRLVNEAFTTPRSALAAEFRPDGSAGEVFDLVLYASDDTPITLQVEGLDAFAAAEVYLIDRETSKAYDLHERSTLPLVVAQQTSRYSLIVGSATFVEETKEALVPEVLALLANYPNPFNPSTVIEYAVPAQAAGASVRLEVFDVLGRRVRVLAEGPHEPGFYRVTWDGSDQTGAQVGSGVYLYRLQVDGRSQVRRMLLVK